MNKTTALASLFVGALLSAAPAQTHRRAHANRGHVSASVQFGPHVRVSGNFNIGPRSHRSARRSYGYNRSTYCPPSRVWVPGYWHNVTVPAIYEWRVDPCGRRYQVLIEAACHRREWVPGYWRTQRRGYSYDG